MCVKAVPALPGGCAHLCDAKLEHRSPDFNMATISGNLDKPARLLPEL